MLAQTYFCLRWENVIGPLISPDLKNPKSKPHVKIRYILTLLNAGYVFITSYSDSVDCFPLIFIIYTQGRGKKKKRIWHRTFHHSYSYPKTLMHL